MPRSFFSLPEIFPGFLSDLSPVPVCEDGKLGILQQTKHELIKTPNAILSDICQNTPILGLFSDPVFPEKPANCPDWIVFRNSPDLNPIYLNVGGNAARYQRPASLGMRILCPPVTGHPSVKLLRECRQEMILKSVRKIKERDTGFSHYSSATLNLQSRWWSVSPIQRLSGP